MVYEIVLTTLCMCIYIYAIIIDIILSGGLEHEFIFPYIRKNNPIWRTHIFQRGTYTTNQYIYMGI